MGCSFSYSNKESIVYKERKIRGSIQRIYNIIDQGDVNLMNLEIINEKTKHELRNIINTAKFSKLDHHKHLHDEVDFVILKLRKAFPELREDLKNLTDLSLKVLSDATNSNKIIVEEEIKSPTFDYRNLSQLSLSRLNAYSSGTAGALHRDDLSTTTYGTRSSARKVSQANIDEQKIEITEQVISSTAEVPSIHLKSIVSSGHIGMPDTSQHNAPAGSVHDDYGFFDLSEHLRQE